MSEQAAISLPYESLPIDDHLALQQLYPADAPRMFEIVEANREELGQWLTWVVATNSVEDAEKYINTTLDKRQAGTDYGYGMFENGELVGHISLMHIDEGGQPPEIGYWIDKDASGKGLTARAVDELVRLGQEDLGLDRIIIKVKPNNIASNRVAEKCGFVLEGVIEDPEAGPTNVWARAAGTAAE